ncbi:MAG: hypothetical protein AAGF50_05860, partial [Pseudomonadota bacterium]
ADAPEIDGNLFIDQGHETLKPGQIVKVEVDEASEYDLWGRVLKVDSAVKSRNFNAT